MIVFQNIPIYFFFATGGWQLANWLTARSNRVEWILNIIGQ